MTIAQAFNDIAIAQGGTPSTSGTIAGAIDALNDALAGSDQASAQTIEDAVRLLGQNIGGGGGSYNIYCIDSNTGDPITSIAYIGSINEEEQMYEIQESATPTNNAQAGETVLIPSTAHLDTICYYESGVLLTPDVPYASLFGYNEETGFVMPQNDVLIVVVSNEQH